jgi:hypothetical protein
VLDATRADRLSTYGYARRTTPNLDALAAGGVVFTSCWAQGTHTRAALPSLFYSRYFARPLFPHDPSVPYSAPEDLFRADDPELVSLPRALSAAGVHTAGISAHTWIGEDTELAREFDEFSDLSVRLPFPPGYGAPSAEQLVDAAIDWMGEHRDEDWFLYLHVMDVHTPRRLDDDARRWYPPGAAVPPRFDAHGVPRDRDAPVTPLDGPPARPAVRVAPAGRHARAHRDRRDGRPRRRAPRAAVPWEAACTHAQPTSAFALAVHELDLPPALPRDGSGSARRLVAAAPPGGWIVSDHELRPALVARQHAPPLDLAAHLPDGRYDVRISVRRRARIDVDGGPRGVHVRGRPIDPTDPYTLWESDAAEVGAVTVAGERFHAVVTPEGPSVVHWVGFTPPLAAHAADPARTERLRALGYVD